jgi:hypothetical protein
MIPAWYDVIIPPGPLNSFANILFYLHIKH